MAIVLIIVHIFSSGTKLRGLFVEMAAVLRGGVSVKNLPQQLHMKRLCCQMFVGGARANSAKHAGFETPTSVFTLVVLVVTIVVCLSHVCFGHFKYLSAHNYKVRPHNAHAPAPVRAHANGAVSHGRSTPRTRTRKWWRTDARPAAPPPRRPNRR